LVLAGVSLTFGISSIVVIPSQYGCGVWGSFFTWPAGILGICGARNVKNQAALLTAHMTLVRFERQKSKTWERITGKHDVVTPVTPLTLCKHIIKT